MIFWLQAICYIAIILVYACFKILSGGIFYGIWCTKYYKVVSNKLLLCSDWLGLQLVATLLPSASLEIYFSVVICFLNTTNFSWIALKRRWYYPILALWLATAFATWLLIGNSIMKIEVSKLLQHCSKILAYAVVIAGVQSRRRVTHHIAWALIPQYHSRGQNKQRTP